LLHEADVHLGLGAPAVLDTIPFMFGIDYGRQSSARGVHELLRSMGVTHLVWQPTSQGFDSFAGDLAFFSYASRFTEQRIQLESYLVATLPASPPSARPFGSTVVISCLEGAYESGVYQFADLATPEFPAEAPHRRLQPRRAWASLSLDDRTHALQAAEFVVAQAGCSLSFDDPALAFLDDEIPLDVRLLARRPPYALYERLAL
jgi:hypothetical protein